MAVGAVLLCLAQATLASIASCGLIGLMGALIVSVVPALLADLHPYRRDTAFAEATAVSCAFGILAPLASGLFLWLILGWRYAVILGAAYGGLLLVRFGRTPLTEPAPVTKSARDKLPASYWAYWCLLLASVALEFSVLLWAPAFIERVAGFATTSAAAVASGFSVGMLAGRFTTSWLVRTISPRLVFLAALAIALFGFGIYWGIDQPLGAMVGIFLLGLGIAPLYPLTLSFAIGVAGGASDAASARCLVGGGFAILVAPAILGALADVVGLRLAHLTLPALVTFALASFLVAHELEPAKWPRVS
jgi:fucose permease